MIKEYGGESAVVDGVSDVQGENRIQEERMEIRQG